MGRRDLILCAALLACTSKHQATATTTSEKGPALAEVGNTTIYVADVEAELASQSAYVRNRYSSDEQKRDFLDNMIRFELLAQEAIRRGLDQQPLVTRRLKQTMIEELLRQEIDNKVTPESITDEQIAAHYATHQDDYKTEEEVRVAAIFVRSLAQAEHVADLAGAESARTNGAFRALVAEYSAEFEYKQTGGDMRYLSRTTDRVPKAVLDAAFALSTIGDTSGPVAADDGYYVLRLVGRKDAHVRTIDEARAMIRNTLYKQARETAQAALLEDLRKQSRVEINEAALANIQPSAASR